MDERSQDKTKVNCAACGSDSSDPQWCSHCGARIHEGTKERDWLEVGEIVVFENVAALVQGNDTQIGFSSLTPAPDLGNEWEAHRTRLDIPALVKQSDDAGLQEALNALATVEPIASSSRDTIDALLDAESAFELLGPTTSADAKPVPHDSTPEGPRDAVVAEQELRAAHSAKVSARSSRIRTVSVRESYAQRRLWDAVDIDDGQSWVLEERRLQSGEKPQDAVSFSVADEVSEQFLFNAVARTLYDGRVLTLYEMPRGQSLETWRRSVGRDGATPKAILSVLEPLCMAVSRMHAAGKVHLHLNPRTVWVHHQEVGFTGVDQLEALPVQRTRFRATLGFSAPEVFGRSKQQISTPADIYSVGAIAYYLIAGVLPPTSPETAFAPAIGPRDFRPSFPPGWGELILHATDPVAARRPPTVEALLKSLQEAYVTIKARAGEAPVLLAVEAETHIGYTKKKRSPINQDSVFVAQSSNRRRILMAVADGVSTATYGSGDLASGFLVKRAEAAWRTVLESEQLDTEAILSDIINLANQDICEYVNEKYGALKAGPSQVMGSTALVAIIDEGLMTLAALGDSRAYLIRQDMMESISRDHNLFTVSLVEGLSIDAVLAIPHGDALARCLGTFDLDREGFLAPIHPPFDTYRLRLLPGDNILLCSDGLFDYAGATYEESEANIKRIVVSENHPGIACLELILLANRGGGGDNIGVVLLKAFADKD